MTKAQTGYITFSDDNVRAICAENWGNLGRLTYEQAAAVTSLGTVFQGNTSIEKFIELQYFTGLTAIDADAFSGCTNLNRVAIPSSVTTIGSDAFQNCSSMTNVCAESIEAWCGITFANAEANPLSNHPNNFLVKNGSGYAIVSTLTIPEGVTTIKDYAFYIGARSFTGDLVIPNSVTSIGNFAFYGCTCFNGSLTIGNSVTTIGESAFENCTSFTGSPTIGNSVTTIGPAAFKGCTRFTGDLVIPDSVITIGFEAFYGCTGFTGNLIIGNSVITIGMEAFRGCTGFTGNLIIGNSVTTISPEAFRGCTGFTGDLVIPNSVTTIGWNAFFNCTGFNGSLILPNSVTRIADGAFDYCSGFTGHLVIPNSVTEIGGDAFENCRGFTGDLVIPNSVTKIWDGAFKGCTGFNGKLTIGNSVSAIWSSAFAGCTGFTGDLILPNSITDVHYYAFKGCTGFTGNLIIRSGTFGTEAFSGCTGFTGCLIIGESVTQIVSDTFKGCGNISKIITPATTPPTVIYWYEEDEVLPLSGLNTSTPVYVPNGTTSTYRSANGWKHFTTFVEHYEFEYDDLFGTTQWSDAGNWKPQTLPTSNDVVCITTDCNLDIDANVSYLYVRDNADVLTINSGKTLTTTYGVGTRQSSQLVIAEGGQLITNYATKGTVQKHIDAFTSANDGWNFIASPVTESLTANFVNGLIPWGETVYDLYYLDEENTYWRNYKQNAFELNHGQGYLYANGAGTTINFDGILQPYVAAGVSIPLSNDGDGWNLVGNPFTFNAYANKPYYVINGRNVEAAVSGAIAPCTGIVVKATGNNQTVTFTKNAPSMSNNQGNLNIVVAEQVATRDGSSVVEPMDNAIVSFNEGDQLGKFYFGEQNANIYIPQGQEEYSIVSVGGRDGVHTVSTEVPINFKAKENGQYTITVAPEGVEMGYLHLIDNMTGADVDLLQTPSYTFEAKTTDYASRFRMVFNANFISEDAVNDETFAFIDVDGNIVINGEGILQVIDVTGRVILSRDARHCVSTTGMGSGVYLIRLINGEDVKVQKIVVR